MQPQYESCMHGLVSTWDLQNRHSSPVHSELVFILTPEPQKASLCLQAPALLSLSILPILLLCPLLTPEIEGPKYYFMDGTEGELCY